MLPAAKRRRVIKWERLPINCDVYPGVVTFIDGTKSELERGNSVEVSESDDSLVHPDTGKPMSVCYQYILFLYPSMNPLDSKAVRSLYPNIELWSLDESNGVKLYMFKSPVKLNSLAMDVRESALSFLSPHDLANIKGVNKSSMDVAQMKVSKICERVTVDLMDPNIHVTIFELTKQCIADDLVRDLETGRVVHPDWHRGRLLPLMVEKVGKIGKIVATGPLVGEYPYDRVPGLSALRNMSYISHLLEIPSTYINNLIHQFKFTIGTTHIQELDLNGLDVDDIIKMQKHITEVDKLIRKNQLKIERYVLPIRDDLSITQTLMIILARETPDIPIYTIIDPGDTVKVGLAHELGIRNFIVDNVYRNDAVLGRLNAHDIKFRALYHE
jgi:hypothetical protein